MRCLTPVEPMALHPIHDGQDARGKDMTKDRSIILTIREYENSVDMPGAERVTYLDPAPRPGVRGARSAIRPDCT